MILVNEDNKNIKHDIIEKINICYWNWLHLLNIMTTLLVGVSDRTKTKNLKRIESKNQNQTFWTGTDLGYRNKATKKRSFLLS